MFNGYYESYNQFYENSKSSYTAFVEFAPQV